MRLPFSAFIACLLVLIACNGPGRASLDLEIANQNNLELLVFEHPDCTYCRVFRRDVLPAYQRASGAMPVRFVDIQRADTNGLVLKSRIDTVPTVVLMRDGAEFDRIVGYWGPDNFFKLLAHMRARAE